jgi:hypothetical protein
MYVYKKKCDEDYYISLIQFTQQQYQYQYNYQQQLQYNLLQNKNMLNQKYYYTNYNNINNNNNDCYKTPKRKKTFQIYKDFSGLNNNVSPSPIPLPNVNYTNNHYINEKNVLNNIRNNGYENYENDLNNNFNNFAHNKNGNINKKIFKLEEFLTDSKMKNSNNNIMNNDIY